MPLDGPAQPHPKAVQLARGEKRHHRKVASAKQWQQIVADKNGACRCLSLGGCSGPVTFHHIVDRTHGGDDLPDNIVPVCDQHHRMITARNSAACVELAGTLTDAEYSYAVGRQGEGFLERRYGLFGEQAA